MDDGGSPRYKKVRHPKEEANLLSSIFFCWTLPTFIKGFKKDLEEEDLYDVLNIHESERLGNMLEDKWKLQLKLRKTPSLARAIWQVFRTEICLYGIICFLLEIIIKLSQPICLGKLMLSYTSEQSSISKNQAYIYGSCIVCASFLNVLLGHTYMFASQVLGLKVRIACSSLIYRKSLKLSKHSFMGTTIGQIVNMLSNDINRFDLILNCHSCWAVPLQVVTVTYLLFLIAGVPALVGLGLFVLFVPLHMFLGKLASKYRLKIAMKTDERVRLLNEVISGIKVIKMYGWEKSFEQIVQKIRNLELNEIKFASFIKATNISFGMFLNRAATFCAILTYVLTGNSPNAYFVYVATVFYNVLRQSMVVTLPHTVVSFSEAAISIRRLETFLNLKEVPECNETNKNEEYAVLIKDAYAKWENTANDFILCNISIKARPAELVAIIGAVGSGKSSIMQMILRELPISTGDRDVPGSTSYASQDPWLFSGTVKENIVLESQFHAAKYNEVCRICSLDQDFEKLPNGDLTVIGERGLLLSGGQKSRINLARAIYRDADVYLLDDPLSAVDSQVGKHLFEKCILGFLKNKCVILITHQIQYLGGADRIYLISGGTVAKSGTYQEFVSSGELQKLYTEFSEKKNDTTDKNIEENNKPLENYRDVKEAKCKGHISKKVYKKYFLAGGGIFKILFIFFLFILTQFCASSTDFFISLWVNFHQSQQYTYPAESKLLMGKLIELLEFNNCVYIYAALVGLIVAITFSRSLLFMKFCISSSKNLHKKMFYNIVNAKMAFFYMNPSGRILNRFSNDIGTIDESLPIVLLDTIQVGLNVLFITIVISTVNAWMLLPSGIILVIFYWLKVIFLASSRNIKRIESSTRSPIYSHVSATLEGLHTIRSFGAEEYFMKTFRKYQNAHTAASYMFISINRAFGFWLDIHCVAYVGLVTLTFVFLINVPYDLFTLYRSIYTGLACYPSFTPISMSKPKPYRVFHDEFPLKVYGDVNGQRGETYAGNVGLAITQALSLTGMFQWGMRQWSELENQMTNVERVVQYTKLETEAKISPETFPRNWPQSGAIQFTSVSLRYSVNETFVLNNINFVVKSGEKIGIVGRTGSGKSSLVSALFLLNDIEGQIIIDGLNTRHVPLHILRVNISIIPQEPVLFSGTIRRNVDPLERYSDADIWKALEDVELKHVILALPHGLDSFIIDGGSNFSVGQKQLICLARAVVRSNKIIVLDEATANIDPQTDELIQETIRRKFKECTVLTIAHRLDTVMDSDKVLVMESGYIVEFDHPYVLLHNDFGIFKTLVNQTGKAKSNIYLQKAFESFEKRKGDCMEDE